MFTNYYYSTSGKFFTRTLAGGLSPEIKWQHVSSALQDQSQYSGWSQQCSSMDGLDSSADFGLCQRPFQDFEGRSEPARYNWYRNHPLSFLSSLFYKLWSVGTAKSTIQQVLFLSFFFFLLVITWTGLLVLIWSSVCISKS